jgi:peroxiredoxin-like protein
METFKIELKWKNDSIDLNYENFNRNHEIQLSKDQHILASAAKTYLGDESKTNPEELLASALASCHMLTFLAICAKLKIVVTHYTDDAVAILDKNDEGKLAITKIILHPEIKLINNVIIEHEKLISLHDKAHKNCFIANSIKCAVEINC